MMTILRASLLTAALAWVALPSGVSAHHSLAGYAEELSELEGELVAVNWRNPHIRMVLSVANEQGGQDLWDMDANSIYNLQRDGISRDLFNIGETVTVAGHKSNRRPFDLQMTNMLFASGREAILWGGSSPRWTDDYFGGRDLLAENAGAVDASVENRRIFRVWTVPNDATRVTHLPFTEAAIAARQAWDLFDNFALRCEPEGMPRIMINPHPFEFIDHGNAITLRTELYDIERTIHMDRSAPPENEPWSRLGYSVGSWEADSLVVTTTRVNWPYFDNRGTPQSQAVEIVERFTLSDDQSQLSFRITVTDPTTFLEPATIDGEWLALGDAIPRYDCQVE